MITTILQLLLVLGLLVLVHEFGHFIVAKLCRVRVETFNIGFGRKLVGFVRGGTSYQINALPLGGYVKFAGEIPGEETSDDPGDVNNHPRWQRMLITVAGPMANFLLAFGLILAVCMLHYEVNEYQSGPAVTDYVSPDSPAAKAGLETGDTIVRFDNVENPTWDDVYQHAALNLNQTVPFSFLHDGRRVNTTLRIATSATSPDDFDPDSLGFVPKMQSMPVKVSTLVPGSPAERAGLKPGDQIVRIDQLQVHSVPTLLAYMQDQKGKPAVLDVLRNGQYIGLAITPELTDVEGTKAYRLGFTYIPPPIKVERLPFAKAVKFSWTFSKKSSRMILDVVKGMFERHISVRSLSGPIGIGVAVHQEAELPGWMPITETVASISINLGMVNLLPFPILDGGMIFLLLVESLFRRDLPVPVKERIFQVAFVCLVCFFAFVIINDISKLPLFVKLKS